MEIGRAGELTILTPNDVDWVRRELRTGNTLGRKLLDKGKGREIRCGGDDGKCPNQSTHYSATAPGKEWRCYCREHWRSEADPRNLFGLNEDDAPAESAGER